jgi:hypothetical protein
MQTDREYESNETLKSIMKIVSEREVMRGKNTCFSLASNGPRIVALLQLAPPIREPNNPIYRV